MGADPKKDNSTLKLKVQLRINLLKEIKHPVILETHGGWGRVYDLVYRGIPDGVVLEKDPEKTLWLSTQRPTWSVYEGDCIRALAAGAGSHLVVNFVDVDPYGECWPVLDAFFGSVREWPDKLAIAVNDGLLQKLRLHGGWNVSSMAGIVAMYGNENLHKHYPEICQMLLKEKAAQVGYRLKRWTAYNCGHAGQMTHFAGLLVKS